MPGRNWEKSSPEEAASRSVFVHIKRSLAVPLLSAFDAADPDSPCPVRFATTQPAQALALINSTFANEESGRHVMTEKPMATRWQDGKAMVQSCDGAGVHLFVVKQNRRNPTLQLLK